MWSHSTLKKYSWTKEKHRVGNALLLVDLAGESECGAAEAPKKLASEWHQEFPGQDSLEI